MANVKWTNELLQEEALKYETRGAFYKGSRNAYERSRGRGILDDVCSHMVAANTSWTNEMLREKALEYTGRRAFQDGAGSAYKACLSRGILDDVCSHMDPLRTYWTNEMLVAEALKYTTRGEFVEGSSGAYQTCLRLGILDEVCSHMTSSMIDWTLDMLHAEALKYTTRTDFAKGSKNAYEMCRRRDLLDVVGGHMEAHRTITRWDTKSYIEHAAKLERNTSYSYEKVVYNGIMKKITITCKEHGDFRQRADMHIHGRGGGCPSCAKSSFDGTKPGIVYYLSLNNGTAYKIGITNNDVKIRFKNERGVDIKVLKTWAFEIGYDAMAMEQKILKDKDFTHAKYKGDPLLQFTGNSELFDRDILGLDIENVS